MNRIYYIIFIFMAVFMVYMAVKTGDRTVLAGGFLSFLASQMYLFWHFDDADGERRGGRN